MTEYILATGLILSWIIAFVLIMSFYFFLRKRYSHHKFLAEGLIIGTLILINIIFRLIVLDFSQFSFATGIVWADKILYATYDVFGALQFEALTEVHIALTPLQSFFTHGMILVTALITISVFASSISYEVYSRFLLFVKRLTIKIFRHRKYNIYVLTDMNKESLMLAKSIKNHHTSKEKKEPYIIIFSGPDLDPFNRKNNLCVEVIGENFLYYSMLKKDNESLLKKLKLLYKNSGLFTSSKRHHKINFISILKENNIELEEDNTELVYKEINNILELKKELNSVIDFYILTSKNTDFSIYDGRLNKIATAYSLKELGVTEEDKKKMSIEDRAIHDKKEKDLVNKFKSHFPIHLINEALLTSFDFSIKRQDVLKSSLYSDISRKDNSYNALILGFGRTGQSVLNQLYVDTTFTNENNLESEFNAVVIDQYIKADLGIYKKTNQYYLIKEISEDVLYKENLRKLLNDENSNLKKEIKKDKKELILKYYEENLKTSINPPVIFYKEDVVTNVKFFDLLDRITGSDIGCTPPYDSIVISMGNDLENVRLANTLISDIKNEYVLNSNFHPYQMTIAVHILNTSYNDFIKWDILDEKEYPHIKVVIFGNINDIYSYDSIINSKEEKLINYGYNFVYKLTSSKASKARPNDSFNESFKNLITNLKEEIDTLDKLNEVLLNSIKQVIKHKMEASWYELDEFKRISNKQVVLYKKTLIEIYKNTKSFNDLTLDAYYYANLEHLRWVRFHIASGFLYKKAASNEEKKKNQLLKIHNALCPFDDVISPDNLFDLINVAFYLKDLKKED